MNRKFEMKMKSIINQAMQELEERKDRSAWDRGVTSYAYGLLEMLEESAQYHDITIQDLTDSKLLEKAMLNGADSWMQYSWSACGVSYVHDADIAERLCTPSELKKTRNGERRPNANEEWLDVQARALYQASSRAKKAIRHALTKEIV